MKPLVLKRKVTDMKEIDVGFTHVAFVVRDLERSIAFYERYAGMLLFIGANLMFRMPVKSHG